MIPECFNQPGAKFTLPPNGKKKPGYDDWQVNGYTYQEANAYPGNVGLLAGGDYISLDMDVPSAFAGCKISASTKWASRPGRLGLWYKCSDRATLPALLKAIHKKPNAAELFLVKDGLPIGELKLERQHAIIPPSWKILDDGPNAGQKVDYKMLDDRPPATISVEDLIMELLRNGISFDKKKSAEEIKQLLSTQSAIQDDGEHTAGRGTPNTPEPDREEEEDQLDTWDTLQMLQDAKEARNDEAREKAYVQSALKYEVEAVRTAQSGDRNNQLNTSVFSVATYLHTGYVTESEIRSAFLAVAEDDEPEKIEPTIESALKAGRLESREIPKGKDPVYDPSPIVVGKFTENQMKVICQGDPNKAKAIFKKHLMGDDLKAALNLLKEYRKSLNAKPEFKIDPAIKEEAERILNEGSAFGYVLGVWQKRHFGDENIGKALYISIGAQSCIDSKGIHVHIRGKRGLGKSDGAEKATKTMPKSHLLVGSVSPKVLYYMGE